MIIKETLVMIFLQTHPQNSNIISNFSINDFFVSIFMIKSEIKEVSEFEKCIKAQILQISIPLVQINTLQKQKNHHIK